jgi:glucose/mannose transport system substrate-binding protein
VGEFESHGLEPGRDYQCWRFPDTQGIFLLNADQYIFFKDSVVDAATRNSFARVLMQPELQIELNRATGAAPARVDIARSHFNRCIQQSISDMRMSNLQRTLMGSIAMGNANPNGVKTAIYQLVTEHFQGLISDADAAQRLRAIIRDAR